MPSPANRDERLCAEAVRVYMRYALEVVEALGLCPWARRARLDGKVRPLAIPAVDFEPADLASVVAAITEDRDVDVGLLILPRYAGDAREFRHFVARLRESYSAHHAPARPPMLMADFHPRGRADASNPQRLVAYIRRTPDPTIQLVRRTALDAARRSTDEGTVYDAQAIMAALGGAPASPPPVAVHVRVAEANFGTVQRLGADRLAAILDDIRRDRDRSYAAIV